MSIQFSLPKSNRTTFKAVNPNPKRQESKRMKRYLLGIQRDFLFPCSEKMIAKTRTVEMNQP